MGKYGTFPVRELIGKAAGFTYDIVNNKLVLQAPQTLEELGLRRDAFVNHISCHYFDLDDTNANNELINDGAYVQPLSYEEIEALKKSGAHASVLYAAHIVLECSPH